MEPLEGIFSSPEKSPEKLVMRSGGTILTSEEMAVAQSKSSHIKFVVSVVSIFEC